MLEALNMPDLRFLVILFDLKPNELLPSALVESILALPDLNADTPGVNPLEELRWTPRAQTHRQGAQPLRRGGGGIVIG